VLLVSHDRALLRGLTTRTWALEDGHITDYPGSFGAWEETVLREEERRTRASAQEAEARREKERRAARRDRAQEKEARVERRALKKRVRAEEERVHGLERRAVELREALADEDLYADAEGVQKAVSLKADLATVEHALSEALDAWADAEEALQAEASPEE
jgi:ATP-binding cassette subfamily F protein 3